MNNMTYNTHEWLVDVHTNMNDMYIAHKWPVHVHTNMNNMPYITHKCVHVHPFITQKWFVHVHTNMSKYYSQMGQHEPQYEQCTIYYSQIAGPCANQ